MVSKRCLLPAKQLVTAVTCVALFASGGISFAHKNSVTDNQNTQSKSAAYSNKSDTKASSKHKVKAKPEVVTSGSLRSHVVYVQDLANNNVLLSKNDDQVRPIASVTKLMTAIVVVDAKQPMSDMIEVTQDDIDKLKHSRSRLPVGTNLSRADMLHLAQMSSENRAASALARYYPGGTAALVQAMNAKAQQLGMHQTRFVEPTGLSSANVSTPRDLVKMMLAAMQRPAIHEFTTDDQQEIRTVGKSATVFRNTNSLVAKSDWDIKVSKTGFINEAGQCLVMIARINNRDTAIVLLDAVGRGTRVADAIRIRQLMQRQELAAL